MDLSRFSCIEEWLEAKGITDGDVPNDLLSEYAGLRSQIWDRHYQSLSEADKALVDSEDHPCDNADRYEEALQFVQQFVQEVESRKFVKKVSLDYFHGHTLVLTVHLTRPMHWGEYRPEIPELYRGVQVFTVFFD